MIDKEKVAEAINANRHDEAGAAIAAVLEQLREPSDEQLIAAQRAMFDGTKSAPPSAAIGIGYRAMIDAATK